MARLGVDFGDSVTVIVTSGESSRPQEISSISVPSVVHLAADGNIVMGDDVPTDLTDSPSTAKHLKHYIIRNSPVLIQDGSFTMTWYDAGAVFLSSLIRRAASSAGGGIEEVVFTIPEASPPHYRDWLASVAAAAGVPVSRCIGEVAAAVAAYGISPDIGGHILVIDAGAHAIRVMVAGLSGELSGAAPRYTILGSAESDTGGQEIDGWLASDVIRRVHPPWRNPVPASRPQLLAACHAARDPLARGREATITISGPADMHGRMITITPEEFRSVLAQHDCFGTIDRTIDRALSAARLKGGEGEAGFRVLVTGELGQMPFVQDSIRNRFGADRVLCNNPQDAFARGAALFHPRPEQKPRLTRDYALRYYDPATRSHQYRYIVRRGTEYPTVPVMTRLLISAAYDGQTRFGISLYALGGSADSENGQAIELVADQQGATRCIDHPESMQAADAIWINRNIPTYIPAIPPGQRGDVRFELEFFVDPGGELRMTARDLRSGSYVMKNHACARLV